MLNLEIFSLSWILAFCTVVLSGFVRGISGFGFALILTPILFIITGDKSVVAVTVLLAFVSNAIVIPHALKTMKFKSVLPITLGNLIGIPLGTWVIVIVSQSLLKMIIGAVIVIFAIPMILGVKRTFTREKLACVISGFFSGVLGASTSLGGPPVVLLMHNQGWRKEAIHSSLTVYFSLSGIFVIIALYITGFITTQVAIFGATLLPGLIIGVFLGLFAFRRINPGVFRILSLCIIACTGIISILSGTGLLS